MFRGPCVSAVDRHTNAKNGSEPRHQLHPGCPASPRGFPAVRGPWSGRPSTGSALILNAKRTPESKSNPDLCPEHSPSSRGRGSFGVQSEVGLGCPLPRTPPAFAGQSPRPLWSCSFALTCPAALAPWTLCAPLAPSSQPLGPHYLRGDGGGALAQSHLEKMLPRVLGLFPPAEDKVWGPRASGARGPGDAAPSKGKRPSPLPQDGSPRRGCRSLASKAMTLPAAF